MKLFATLAILTVSMAMIGCAGQKPATDSISAAPTLDTTTQAAPATAYRPEPLPVTMTPVVAPVQEVSMTSPPTGPSTGNTHVVKKGETLYSVAKQHYGSGKEWKKIAMANPGISPSTLKVGQTLVIP